MEYLPLHNQCGISKRKLGTLIVIQLANADAGVGRSAAEVRKMGEACYDRQLDMQIRKSLAEHAAPVLVNLKCANLIWIPGDCQRSQQKLLNALDQQLQTLSVRSRIFYTAVGGSYVLVYQRDLLIRQLEYLPNQEILNQCGYETCQDSLEAYLLRLQERFSLYHSQGNVFPHEIGVFLGYPAADVEGYIRYGGKQYLACGYWKAYQDVTQAKKLWQQYDQAKRAVMELVKRNSNMAVLAGFRVL